MSEKKFPNALQADYTLHWYQIRQVLGQGAFGITYLAHDINLDRAVAIKEYMPGSLCTRESDLSIQPLSEEHQDDFKWGLTRFINEARTLTKFEHPNLVRVFNVFEMNNTAYMVMNYEVGRSLSQILKQKKNLSEKELFRILVPLMNGLELMHEKGFIHRDIKPGNIFIRNDGSPVLLDFGSARQTRGRSAHTLTNFVSPGYAPIEQYTSKSDRQGPWTDIYGLGATLYKVITGVSPMNAIDRSEMLMNGMADDFKEISELAKGRYSEQLLKAIDHALAFNVQDRPHDIAEWRREFGFYEEDVKTAPLPQGEINTAVTATLKQDTEKTLAMDAEAEWQSRKSGSDATTINLHGEAADEDITVARSRRFETAGFLGRHKTPVALGATAIAVAAVAVSVLTTGNPGQSGTTAAVPAGTKGQAMSGAETGGNEPAAVDPAMSVAASTDEKGSAGSRADAGDEEIYRLLASAEKDLKALRLMTPAGNNAYEKYSRVLEMDGQNRQAGLGYRRIADKYVQLAYGSMQNDRLEQAGRYLDNAEKADPGSTKIADARGALQSRREQDTGSTAGEFIDNVKAWFRDTAEEEKTGTGESSSSERVKRSLGGR